MIFYYSEKTRTNVQKKFNFKTQNSKFPRWRKLAACPQFKIPQTLSEPSAKESRRAGAAEYVTKDERRIKACAARTEG